ncbi:aspartate aminotransferase [Kluyveromyces marxianus DMKU3-1042]|uniref:aspartate transaminase n=1 Tax=Kluyveromyces marxianus (strain DMKU3-1042 / BCC 29191 / NBRC 104275) TaxID=1003335 RepID=W0T8Z5_KLUMD|nr:aspartate aminotransferase [Kluyveromyces marxianus DMKU3-1042]BAO40107.1 aspartate aminotransferase [Kluyveromyces marxianus DMKU3-1042]
MSNNFHLHLKRLPPTYFVQYYPLEHRKLLQYLPEVKKPNKPPPTMSRTLLNSIEELPGDALFAIKQRLAEDPRDVKVDLGIGAYRDNNGKPWVLPAVRKAETLIHADPSFNHEYLGINGLPGLTSGAARILLGETSNALAEKRVVSAQSLSGTGALHIAAKFISKFFPEKVIYLSDPTWANHVSIFESQGLKTATYPYWDAATKSLNLEGFLKAIEESPRGSVFVLHACAHNPTGLDPSESEWVQILDACVKNDIVPLFDSAYQGFASGSLDKDAYAVRLGVSKFAESAPIFICQSFAKNVGMYGERCGCIHIVLPRPETGSSGRDVPQIAKAITSQLSKITRSEVSNPPAYGAKIVSKILNDEQLTAQWHEDMITMSQRITKMRHSLRDKLVELGTPGNWDHIVNQCGMFSYTGLTKQMVERLESEHAVYMVASGRASIAGLNDNNVEHVAKAIDEVVRHFQSSSSSKL